MKKLLSLTLLIGLLTGFNASAEEYLPPTDQYIFVGKVFSTWPTLFPDNGSKQDLNFGSEGFNANITKMQLLTRVCHNGTINDKTYIKFSIFKNDGTLLQEDTTTSTLASYGSCDLVAPTFNYQNLNLKFEDAPKYTVTVWTESNGGDVYVEGGRITYIIFYEPEETPNTPTSATSFVGGGYQPIDSTLTVGISPISSADYYEIYYSDNGSDYSKVATTWGTTETVSIRSTYGYFYVRYKACNNSGCSGYSPTQRGLAYTFSAYPRSLTSSSYGVAKNESFTLTIEQAGGSVDGTIYELEESFNGGDYSSICTRTRVTWQDMFFACPVSGKLQSGSYRYRVKACNPLVLCSGYTFSGYVEVAD